ncbi:hypothetical protein [Rhizobium leguminosarum]|uniref:hypothetical protein n=1 Tax=Rhizobium leguminosarum TaxID=384 RepID=UPI00037E1039|nr:hypothetical protein [Rhizobium leguminosarum]
MTFMVTTSETFGGIPPVEPAPEEQQTTLDRDFLDDCQSTIAELKLNNAWTFKEELQTRSVIWGELLRRDFLIPGEVPEYVNRLICWKSSNGRAAIAIAVGQDLKPL